MTTDSERVRRYLEDDLAECRTEAVDERLAELEGMASTEGTSPVESDVQILSTLGNETRYRLVRVLADADDELCVCELNALVDGSESAISHALSDLREAGLVTRRKDGRWRMYRATATASGLVTALDEVRTDG